MLPFTHEAYRRDLGADLLQAYVAAREADLPIELLRERDGLPDTARLYLVPSAKLLTGPGCERLPTSSRRRARPSTSRTSPGVDTDQRGPWLDLARRDLRRAPPAALRAGRPDRGRRGRPRVRRGPRRPRGRHAAPLPRRRRAERPLPTCRSTRSERRSSPSTGTAGRRSSGTRWARARRCSAPTRSSTWPRARRGSTPRTPGRLYSALACARRRVATGPRRRPARPRRAGSGAGDRDHRLRQLLERHRAGRAGASRTGKPLEPAGTLDLGPFGVAALRRSRCTPTIAVSAGEVTGWSPRAKGGMRSSEQSASCATSHAGWRAAFPAARTRARKERDHDRTRRERTAIGLGIVARARERRGRVPGAGGAGAAQDRARASAQRRRST